MPPTPPRATVDFDTGIGADAPDPRLAEALAGLERQKHAAYLAARPQAPSEAKPEPILLPAPPLTDEYRAKNPALPSVSFKTVEHLPSVGRPYPPGTTLRYRPYTLGESLFVEESRPDMRGTYALILKGIECHGLNPMDLTLPDVLFLGLIRKIASLGDTQVSVTTTCPFCGGLNRTPVDTNQLDFEDLQVPALPVRVPFSFGEHTFSPLTLSRYLDLLDRNLEGDFVALMAAQRTSLPDLDAAMEMLRSMTDADDIAAVKQVDMLLHHELKPVTLTCPQELPGPAQPTETEVDEPAPTCGGRYPVALDDVSAAFVLPFSGGTGNRPGRQITFG